MRLNHLNLTVSDVGAAEQFLTTYFDLRNDYPDEGSRNFVVLFDDNDLVLTLMKSARRAEVQYPGNFHIGFIQESAERVNELYARLKADGYDVEAPQPHHAWTFYVQAPGGFTVEVLA